MKSPLNIFFTFIVTASMVMSFHPVSLGKVPFPDKERLDSYKSDKDFIYKREPVKIPYVEEIVRIVKDFIKKYFQKPLDDADIYSYLSYIKYGGIAVMGLTLLFFIMRFFGVGIFSPRRKKISSSELLSELEDIHNPDLNLLIKKYKEEENYPVAVRLYFNKMLKDLSDKELIRWRIDKTNSDYAKEIENQVLQKGFIEAAKIFEYVWYGNFPVSHAQFQEMEKPYLELLHTINEQ